MKNKIEKGKYSPQKTTSSKKDQNEILNKKNLGLKNSNIKSQEKMIIKIDENIQKEIEQEQEKRPKIKIFNNKKNNVICSELLKSTINQEKELILIPYAKEKQKINKTLNTIGNAHGISYPNCSVIKGILSKDKNYLAIIRDNDKKSDKKKRNKITSSNKKEYIAEINLEDNIIDNNNLKEMLGNAKNIKNFI